MGKAPVKVKLHVLSPTHIGSGEVFEPTTFYIEVEKKRLCLFDPSDFVDSLDDAGRKEFSDVCMKADLLQVMRVIRKYSDKVPVIMSLEVPVAVANRYEEVLKMSSFDKTKVINKFTLGRLSYCPNGFFAYIPGSSLKGSLRTAYLNHLNNGKNSGRDSKKYKDLEKDLLGGSFDNDPFRMLHSPDLLPAENVRTRLLYAVNRKKKIPAEDKGILSDKGPDQILEVIEPGSIFEGILSLDEPPKGSKIDRPLKAGDLFSATQKFYSTRYEADRQVLAEIGESGYYREMDERLARFRDDLGQKAVLVRLGRHSGAEALTLDGVRSIKIMQGPGRPAVQRNASSTVWLASQTRENKTLCMPFGWAVIEIESFKGGSAWMSNPLPDRLRENAAASSDASRKKLAIEAVTRRELDQKAQELALQAEAEKKQKEEDEARALAEWEALTEDERLIRTPTLPNVTEQQVVECFNKLDSLVSPHKEKLAEELKQYYMRNNKWTGGSKKQVEKVKKLKIILGE